MGSSGSVRIIAAAGCSAPGRLAAGSALERRLDPRARGWRRGAINVVVGSGTLITFPVLLAWGFAPVTANVSNSLGLAPGALTGAVGYRRDLEGQGRRAARLALATVIGAVGGAVLLLVLPPSAFKSIVPVFIVLALVLIVVQPRLSARLARRSRRRAQRTPRARARSVRRRAAHRRLRRLLRCGPGHHPDLDPRDRPQRQSAARQRREEPARGAGQPDRRNRLRLRRAARRLAGRRAARGVSISGGTLGARYGRRLPPTALRALIVAVAIIAIVRLV